MPPQNPQLEPQTATADSTPKNGLGRNSIWMLLGTAVYSIFQWGILMALAKLGSPSLVGEFTYALAVTSPIFLFTNLGLRSILAADVHDDFAWPTYMTLRIVGMVCGFLVTLVVLLARGTVDETSAVTLAMVVSKTSDSVSDLTYGLLQKHEVMRRIAISRVLIGIGQFLCLVIPLKVTGNLFYSVLSMALANVFINLVYDLKALTFFAFSHASQGLFSYWRQTQALQMIRKLLVLALPLGAITCLDVLVLNVPRYFVESHGGKAALGYFSAIAYLMIGGNTVVNAVVEAARPQLAKRFYRGKGAFLSLVLKLLVLVLAVGLGNLGVMALWGKTILTLLYNSTYAQYSREMIILMVGACLWYLSTPLSTALSATRSFYPLISVLLVTILLTYGACMVLVPTWGVAGAAWAINIGMATRFLCSLVGVLWKSHGITAHEA